MSFRDNLQHLRATRNMTQEQLAMLVGVSRQAVTKWEAERAYPEMDKLLKLCDIFDCTLDELVTGDLTDRAADPAHGPSADAPATDVVGYEEHMCRFADRISAGVASIIAGIALSALFEGVNPWAFADPDALSTVALMVGVAIGLVLIIPAGIRHAGFKSAHPYVQDFYSVEQRESIRRRSGYEITAGIALILVAVAVSTMVPEGNAIDCGFMLCIAVGASVICHGGMRASRINVDAYNLDAMEDLSEEEVTQYLGTEKAAAAIAQRRTNKRVGAICAAIMLTATIIALVILFCGLGSDWQPTNRLFWIPWPIGGITCGIVAVVAEAFGPDAR